MKEMVIGLDQSYTDTGIGIAVDGKLKWVGHCSFTGCSNKAEKRLFLNKYIKHLYERYKSKYNIVIVTEGIRLFSGQDPHISRAYISSAYAMIGSLVDLAYSLGIPIYSVETRSWKKAVLGSSKNSDTKLEGVKDQKKVASVKFILHLGFEKQLTTITRGGKIKYNDNIADAGCIALSYFHSTICKSLGGF